MQPVNTTTTNCSFLCRKGSLTIRWIYSAAILKALLLFSHAGVAGGTNKIANYDCREAGSKFYGIKHGSDNPIRAFKGLVKLRFSAKRHSLVNLEYNVALLPENQKVFSSSSSTSASLEDLAWKTGIEYSDYSRRGFTSSTASQWADAIFGVIDGRPHVEITFDDYSQDADARLVIKSASLDSATVQSQPQRRPADHFQRPGQGQLPIRVISDGDRLPSEQELDPFFQFIETQIKSMSPFNREVFHQALEDYPTEEGIDFQNAQAIQASYNPGRAYYPGEVRNALLVDPTQEKNEPEQEYQTVYVSYEYNEKPEEASSSWKRPEPTKSYVAILRLKCAVDYSF